MRRQLVAACLLGLLAAGPAFATSTTPGQGPDPAIAALKQAAARFPQPVRVGDLAGRVLLGPMEAQPIYGRVAAAPVVRGADGTLYLIVARGGWFGWLGWGGTPAAVALDDVALLGEHVALVGLTREGLDALPGFTGEGMQPVADSTVIRMGIVGPFH